MKKFKIFYSPLIAFILAFCCVQFAIAQSACDDQTGDQVTSFSWCKNINISGVCTLNGNISSINANKFNRCSSYAQSLINQIIVLREQGQVGNFQLDTVRTGLTRADFSSRMSAYGPGNGGGGPPPPPPPPPPPRDTSCD